MGILPASVFENTIFRRFINAKYVVCFAEAHFYKNYFFNRVLLRISVSFCLVFMAKSPFIIQS